MRVVWDAIRGGLIGVAEVIPGVSGGTVALIVGVYQTIISSASAVVRGFLSLFVPRLRVHSPWADVQWARIIPIILGMLAAIVVAARVLEPLLETYPEHTRALFAGLIVMSLWVPITMVGGRFTVREMGVVAVAAVMSFILVGFPAGSVSDPSLWLVVPSAAVAVCALVLPGVSGSFLLLTLGMYEPTIDAVNTLDVAYLGAFIVGAILGLGSFVVLLQWLLLHRRRITLVVMTGLMVGSLRALWPWQGEGRELLAPQPETLMPAVGLFFAGVVVVALLIGLERAMSRRETASEGSR
jgi:putative membrane protein